MQPHPSLKEERLSTLLCNAYGMCSPNQIGSTTASMQYCHLIKEPHGKMRQCHVHYN